MKFKPIRLFGATLLFTAAVFAADPPATAAVTPNPEPVISAIPEPEQPPDPHCDPYSLQTLPRLDFAQRACLWRSNLFTGTAFAGAALSAGIAQFSHDPKEWPQGMQGYGYRIGTRYAQGMVKSTATFLAGAISREDPRPLPPDGFDCPMQSSSVPARIGRSLARVVVSYHLRADGTCGVRLAPARIVGSLASGFVQLAWLPDSQNDLSHALRGSGTAFGGYIGSSLFAEFQGDLWRGLGALFTRGKSNRVVGGAQ